MAAPTQQFLNTVLSQRGPSALPYAEDSKWLIRQHLLALAQDYPSLHPETASFTHNDGRSVNLLRAAGTVPMSFQGVTYNIPVVFWLLESYPRHPPRVFVNPTRDMIIKRPHPHVNPSGLVSVPYLHSWVYPSSNLVDLARSLTQFFSIDPPLFSRRPSPNPNPNPNPTPNPNPNLTPAHQNSSSASSYASNSYSSPSYTSSLPRPARVYPPSPYGGGTGGGGRIPPQAEDPTEVYRRNAVNKLVESLHGDIDSLGKAREVEMDGLFGVQTTLRHREEQLASGIREMLDEKEGLEQQLQMVLTNSDVLECWLRDNQGKVKDMGSLDAADSFEPCDALSKQMLDCNASDLAIEDVIYALDKAVQEGSIPFDQYLRNVRLLSREQFFHRAMASKVRAAQMQAQVANMASRAHYLP